MSKQKTRKISPSPMVLKPPISPIEKRSSFDEDSNIINLADSRQLEEIEARSKAIFQKFNEMGMLNWCQVDAKQFRSFDSNQILQASLAVFEECLKDIPEEKSVFDNSLKWKNKSKTQKEGKMQTSGNEMQSQDEIQDNKQFSSLNFLINLAWQKLDSKELTSQFCWSLIDELKTESVKIGELRIVLQLFEESDINQIRFYLNVRKYLINFLFFEGISDNFLFISDYYFLSCEQWILLNSKIFKQVSPQETLDFFQDRVKSMSPSSEQYKFFSLSCYEYLRISLLLQTYLQKKYENYSILLKKFSIKQNLQKHKFFTLQQPRNSKQDDQIKFHKHRQSAPQSSRSPSPRKQRLSPQGQIKENTDKFGKSFYRWGWPYFSKEDFERDIQLSEQRKRRYRMSMSGSGYENTSLSPQRKSIMNTSNSNNVQHSGQQGKQYSQNKTQSNKQNNASPSTQRRPPISRDPSLEAEKRYSNQGHQQSFHTPQKGRENEMKSNQSNNIYSNSTATNRGYTQSGSSIKRRKNS